MGVGLAEGDELEVDVIEGDSLLVDRTANCVTGDGEELTPVLTMGDDSEGEASKVVEMGVGSVATIVSKMEDVPKKDEKSLDEPRTGAPEVKGASNVVIIGVESKVEGLLIVPVKEEPEMGAISVALTVGVAFVGDEIDASMCEVEMALVLKCEDRLGSMSVVEIIVKGVSSPNVLLGLADDDVEVFSSTKVKGASNVVIIGVESKVEGLLIVPVKEEPEMGAISVALTVGVAFVGDEIDASMCEVEMALVLKCEDRLGSMSVVEIIVKGVSSPNVLLGLADDDVGVFSSTKVELTVVGGVELGSGMPLVEGDKVGSVP